MLFEGRCSFHGFDNEHRVNFHPRQIGFAMNASLPYLCNYDINWATHRNCFLHCVCIIGGKSSYFYRMSNTENLGRCERKGLELSVIRGFFQEWGKEWWQHLSHSCFHAVLQNVVKAATNGMSFVSPTVIWVLVLCSLIHDGVLNKGGRKPSKASGRGELFIGQVFA